MQIVEPEDDLAQIFTQSEMVAFDALPRKVRDWLNVEYCRVSCHTLGRQLEASFGGDADRLIAHYSRRAA